MLRLEMEMLLSFLQCRRVFDAGKHAIVCLVCQSCVRRSDRSYTHTTPSSFLAVTGRAIPPLHLRIVCDRLGLHLHWPPPRHCHAMAASMAESDVANTANMNLSLSNVPFERRHGRVEGRADGRTHPIDDRGHRGPRPHILPSSASVTS